MRNALPAVFLALALCTVPALSDARNYEEVRTDKLERFKTERAAHLEHAHWFFLGVLALTVGGLVVAERRVRRRIAWEQAEAYLAREASQQPESLR